MEGHVLVDACFQVGTYYNVMCFIERHVLLEVMFHLRVCTIGGHVLLFKMSYWGIFFFLQEGISYRIICCTRGHLT